MNNILLEALDAEKGRRDLRAESERLTGSLYEFILAAWPLIVPFPITPTWHIKTIAEHLEAAYAREITRLLITIQPGALKSTLVSVMGPAWRWTVEPTERFVTASWQEGLSTRDTRKSRELIQSNWYKDRFDKFSLVRDENLKTRYSNSLGGHRVATYVTGGTGERGDILQLDDPHNAQEAASAFMLAQASEWWGSTWASRLNDSVERKGVKIVIGQRIHSRDLIGYLISEDDNAKDWVHLCLPALYERKHPYKYPSKVKLSSGRVLQGDPRKKQNETLAPTYMDFETLMDATKDMTLHVFAGQYQQRPAPREGAILKREWWNFYDPKHRSRPDKLPRFGMVVISVDTPQKDKETSDNVAIQCWGVAKADRYLLDLDIGRMNYGKAKRRVIEMANWARKLWPWCAHFVLIENAGYGVEMIVDLRKEITGVTKISPGKDGDKVMRAESASDALESRNVYVPGISLGADNTGGIDERNSPSDVVSFIDSCALFPYGPFDDDVDAWSQTMNWLRGRSQSPARTASALKGFSRRNYNGNNSLGFQG